MQISDSHIGFSNAPNTDVAGTLNEAVQRVAQLKGNSALLIHTGDVSQLSRPAQFDTAQQIIGFGLSSADARAFHGCLPPYPHSNVWRRGSASLHSTPC